MSNHLWFNLLFIFVFLTMLPDTTVSQWHRYHHHHRPYGGGYGGFGPYGYGGGPFGGYGGGPFGGYGGYPGFYGGGPFYGQGFNSGLGVGLVTGGLAGLLLG